jgi:hypothetical protein
MSKGASSTESKTDVVQQQVGASGGATAIGADADVRVDSKTNIEQVSDDIAIASIEGVADVSSEGFETLERVSGSALDTVGQGQRDALDFGETSLQFAKAFIADQNAVTEATRQGNLNQAQRTAELVAAQAGVVSPTTFESQQKTLLIGIAVVLAGAFLIVRNKRK